MIHSSTFLISAIYYLIYGDLYNQIDFKTLSEENPGIRYSITYGTVYHYIGQQLVDKTFTTLIIQHIKDSLLALSSPLMVFTLPL